MPDGADSIWMTYREIAEALGISQLAAEARVRRAKWRRVLGNQAGVAVARIEVPSGALDSLRDRMRRAAEAEANLPGEPVTELAAEGPTQLDGFHPFFRRLAADLDQAQAALEERTRELVETRESLAEQKGTVAGLREAVRVAETAAADAAWGASLSDKRAERAEAELARLRARGFWARTLNRV
jgi:DNA-binding Lrp family transcriptional regulator